MESKNCPICGGQLGKEPKQLQCEHINQLRLLVGYHKYLHDTKQVSSLETMKEFLIIEEI